MLKRKYRLNLKNFKSRFSIGSSLFTIKVASNKESTSRFAFLVTGGTDKRAVVRNRARRQMQHCIKNLIYKIKPGLDLLFIVRKEALNKKTEEVCQEVEKQLEKEGFFRS